MTALLLSDIHTSIATVEQAAAYFGQIMFSQYSGSINLTDNEGRIFQYPYSQHDVFQSNDRISYARYEYIIPLKADAAVVERYSWMHAEEIDKNSPILFPETYKTANLNP